MFIHYLKIAFRNMWKYKSQTLISVLGLAVGFTCFALATLWIVYEMTYDSFHKNAKQMYVVYRPYTLSPTGYSRSTVNPLAEYLKETFPEIVNATPLVPSNSGGKITVEGVEVPALIIRTDSSFLRMFDVRIIEGSMEFLVRGSNKIAITQEKARKLFGNEDPIGKTVTMGDSSIEICAIVSDMSKRSNYAFDFIQPFFSLGNITVAGAGSSNPMWLASSGENTIIELLPGVNIEAFEKKLYEHDLGEARSGIINKLTIKPLTKIRYIDQTIEREVKFQHILIFALSGLLAILCSLFNYLTLFICRLRMRQKELALRVVVGATWRSLMAMLSVEFLLTLSFAVVLGCCFTQLTHKSFLALSAIKMGLPAIYGELLVYIGGIISISLPVFWFILFIFRRRSLDISIRRGNKNLFRKISVAAQLLISIGFAFCVIVILKQMYFLHHTDELGFSFKNRGSLIVYQEYMQLSQGQNNAGQRITMEGMSEQMSSELPMINLMRQIPEITEVVDAGGLSRLLPQSGHQSQDISSWDDKPSNIENINLERMSVSPAYTAFYDFQLLEGEMLTDGDLETTVLLNEIAVNAFGWREPVGKQFSDNRNTYTVKGVVRYVSNLAPTIPAKPGYYVKFPQGSPGTLTIRSSGMYTGRLVLFKYHEGMWNSCKGKIEQLRNEFEIASIYNDEEEYDNYLKSENALIKLLTFVSAICVLICVFGFVSLVSLACEERRKEIAIRKIHGATVNDILSIFAKEYSFLLVIGAAVAFPVGWLIMHRWLENYVKQTSIAAWIYLSIICVLALVIVLCVGWRVYKSSIENPAHVIKSE